MTAAKPFAVPRLRRWKRRRRRHRRRRFPRRNGIGVLRLREKIGPALGGRRVRSAFARPFGKIAINALPGLPGELSLRLFAQRIVGGEAGFDGLGSDGKSGALGGWAR